MMNIRCWKGRLKQKNKGFQTSKQVTGCSNKSTHRLVGVVVKDTVGEFTQGHDGTYELN